MGIVNVTPDSFHAASRMSLSEAVTAGQRMWDAGAVWVDVGGESTRPGAKPVPVEDELSRVSLVVSSLRRARPKGAISVDTRRHEVAAAALEMGADMVNDVSGLRDPEMRQLVLARKAPVCIMHMRGEPGKMQQDPTYDDVVAEVAAELHEAAEWLLDRGHPKGLICLDPGIGFGKTLEHNLALLTPEAVATLRGEHDFSVLWGTSRKSFLKALTGREDTNDRLPGTLATAAHAQRLGVDVLRVHDIEAHMDVAKVLAAL